MQTVMRPLSHLNPAEGDFFRLPCMHPIPPAMKRLYVQILVLVVVVIVGVNVMHPYPGHIGGCRSELQA